MAETELQALGRWWKREKTKSRHDPPPVERPPLTTSRDLDWMFTPVDQVYEPQKSSKKP